MMTREMQSAEGDSTTVVPRGNGGVDNESDGDSAHCNTPGQARGRRLDLRLSHGDTADQVGFGSSEGGFGQDSSPVYGGGDDGSLDPSDEEEPGNAGPVLAPLSTGPGDKIENTSPGFPDGRDDADFPLARVFRDVVDDSTFQFEPLDLHEESSHAGRIL